MIEAFDLIDGVLGRVTLGDLHPVRIMAVINLSHESFYKGSVAGLDDVLSSARALADEGADLIDLGAVSTAPGSPKISEDLERERLMPALKVIMDNLDVPISIDTKRPGIAREALSLGADCINDVSGLRDPDMVRAIADHDGSAVIMASREIPGDLLRLDEIIPVLAERLALAEDAGISPHKICLDPGVGHWIPEKTPEYDLAILDGLKRMRVLGRPVMAAISRKSFIGALLNQPDPGQRLCGTLSATAVAIYNGAHIVRTHDVSASIETVRMAEAIRSRPAGSEEGEISVEVCSSSGHGSDLLHLMRRVKVDPGGDRILCAKGSFRVLALSGISSMEAIIIKQEMLARGGDAAIPRAALRCDPEPETVLILGTVSQISGLVRKLKVQPFRLPAIAKAISAALKEIDNPERYR